MTVTMPERSLSKEMLVANLFSYFERYYEIQGHIRENLRESPSVDTLDRVMAFRSEPWYGEFRAALDRIEKGQYGLCTLCRHSIEQEKLERVPASRMCNTCLERFGLEGMEEFQPTKHQQGGVGKGGQPCDTQLRFDAHGADQR